MINNTHAAQFIPATKFHYVTGTWTDAAGQVAGTIAKHKAATAETAVVTIPIEIPSNSVNLQGAKLLSIEVDYEVLVADLTSITAVLNKVTRGADTAVAVVAAVTITQAPTAASAKIVEQHKLVLTITTPFYLLNTEYVLAALSCVAPGGTTLDFLGAVANFTLRL